MNWFIEWWDSIPLMCQIYALIAISATAFLIIQLCLMMFGFDHDGDISEIEAGDEVGLNPFSIRAITAFFALFGWCGVACIENNLAQGTTLCFAVAAGLIGLILVTLTAFGFSKLQEDGTKDISTAIGKIGTVYIPIPAQRAGTGKVNMVISGSLGEFDAYTDSKNELARGSSVEVVEILNNNILIVMPFEKRKEE